MDKKSARLVDTSRAAKMVFREFIEVCVFLVNVDERNLNVYSKLFLWCLSRIISPRRKDPFFAFLSLAVVTYIGMYQEEACCSNPLLATTKHLHHGGRRSWFLRSDGGRLDLLVQNGSSPMSSGSGSLACCMTLRSDAGGNCSGALCSMVSGANAISSRGVSQHTASTIN